MYGIIYMWKPPKHNKVVTVTEKQIYRYEEQTGGLPMGMWGETYGWGWDVQDILKDVLCSMENIANVIITVNGKYSKYSIKIKIHF